MCQTIKWLNFDVSDNGKLGDAPLMIFVKQGVLFTPMYFLTSKLLPEFHIYSELIFWWIKWFSVNTNTSRFPFWPSHLFIIYYFFSPQDPRRRTMRRWPSLQTSHGGFLPLISSFVYPAVSGFSSSSSLWCIWIIFFF